MKKKKTVKKAAKKAAPKKKAAKKSAPAATLFKAVCNDDGISLTGWTSKTAAHGARNAHLASFPNHSCSILKK
jgi:hypothetical protein